MKTIDLSGKLRETTGKKEANKLRTEGNVPCVVYGGEEPVHFYAHKNEFLKLVYTPNVYIVNLNLDGKKSQAIIQDIQFHPVNDAIIHVDFLQVIDDKPVKLEVPVKTTGFAKGVKAGGKLQVEKRRLKIKALPKDLPDVIEIDITKLSIGSSIRVGDIERENITFLNNPSVPVVRVVVTRVAKGAELPEDEEDEAGEESADESSSDE